MNILLVHAHPESKSFNAALRDTAVETLAQHGHEVRLTDLYAEAFHAPSDRRNFTTTKDPAFLKLQMEEMHASANNGFAPDIEREIARLEWCDALILQFPLWWFGMPAILKGWVDRVFASGRVYGGGKWYETGIGASRKRALVSMTTGGPPPMYSGAGLNPALDAVLLPIHHGVFWFNGFLTLEPFVAWSAARVGDDGRRAYLEAYRARLARLFDEPTITFPPVAQFDPAKGFIDRWARYHITLTLRDDSADSARAVDSVCGALKRRGDLLSSTRRADGRRWWIVLRAPDADSARAAVSELSERFTVEVEEAGVPG